MSWGKNELIRRHELGAETIGGYCCANCICCPALADFIQQRQTDQPCDYCRSHGAADLDEVIEEISRCLHTEYQHDGDGVSRDSETGWFIKPMDTSDLIGDECPVLADSPAYEKILEAFGDTCWWQADVYAMTETEKRYFTWEAFCQQVMHVSRFGFRPKPEQIDPADDTGFREPFDILEEIRKLCEDRKEAWYWIGPAYEVKELFRARLCDEKKHYTDLKDYGLPPDPRMAAQNRFSPAGIPMLYVAENAATAALETAESAECERQFQSVGSLMLKRRLRVLDLTKFEPVPCIFDEARRSKRAVLRFLHQFARDVSKPICRGFGIHYEYVPTQVVAEFFRHVVKDHEQRGPTGLDGIAYASSRPGGGKCLTIFPELDRHGVKEDWQDSTFELGAICRFKAEWSASLTVIPLP